MVMWIELRDRTEETVITYFGRTRDPEVRRFLPQKAAAVEEALADYRKTQGPGASSYGRTIWADGCHVGDIWCYGIQTEEPNAMVSYCVFDKGCWGRGVATAALGLFLEEIRERFGLRSVGAFTYAENAASVRVLRKNGFREMETFAEDGLESTYYRKAW